MIRPVFLRVTRFEFVDKHALVRIDTAEVPDDPEPATLCLGDVHVHPGVMLARHHLGRSAWAVGGPGVIERPDDRA